MVSKLTSTAPRDHGDGTFAAVLLEHMRYGSHGLLLRTALPPGPEAEPASGRFFMLRCVDDTSDARHGDWSAYLRRPLFVAGLPVAHAESAGFRWDLFAPAGDRQTMAWLQTRPPGTAINLTGPFGKPHVLTPHSRTLLVVAQPPTLPPLLPWIHAMLDQGGRVALILHQPADLPASLLPIPVELHLAATTDDLHRQLAATLRWADQCVIGLPAADLAPIAALIRQQRFRLEPGFALAHVHADLACGFGACLACVVAKPDGGHTRACLNGPFFPLEELAR